MEETGRWEFRNDGRSVVHVTFEPSGEVIQVDPGSHLVIMSKGGVQPPSGTPALQSTREGNAITVWQEWTGSVAVVHLDGMEI